MDKCTVDLSSQNCSWLKVKWSAVVFKWIIFSDTTYIPAKYVSLNPLCTIFLSVVHKNQSGASAVTGTMIGPGNAFISVRLPWNSPMMSLRFTATPVPYSRASLFTSISAKVKSNIICLAPWTFTKYSHLSRFL